MRTLISSFTILCFMTLSALPAHANRIFEDMETNVTITVKASDAKFIGTSMGGAHIKVVDKLTGDILAEGITHGSTGDTSKIMADTIARDAILVDDKTAAFEFTLALLNPTAVTITATGPLAQPQAQASVSIDYILLPGKDYTSGNGIMLEMPGMVVDVLTPVAGSYAPFDAEKPLLIRANILKMCGCQIAEDRPWPPSRYEVEAHIYKGEQLLGTAKMGVQKKPSLYATNITVPEAGIYKILVTAFDPLTKDSGMDATTITLTVDE